VQLELKFQGPALGT